MGMGQMKYLVLAREDLTNQVEGRALRNKTTSAVCKFLLKDVICRYGCVGKIVTDRGELDENEFRVLFENRRQTIAHHGIQPGRKWEGGTRT